MVRVLRICVGVMPCSWLYCICFSRRRFVSSMVFCMESVMLSAYMMARPLTLRAARPIVWVRLRCERRKPSLSASRMATSETSGRSRPSRRRLTPTSTSYLPLRRLSMIWTRSRVSTSECMYAVLMSWCRRYSLSSSAIRFVSVVTSTRSWRSMRCCISSIRSSIWLFEGRTSMRGSRRPVGRMSCSTTMPSLFSSS